MEELEVDQKAHRKNRNIEPHPLTLSCFLYAMPNTVYFVITDQLQSKLFLVLRTRLAIGESSGLVKRSPFYLLAIAPISLCQ